MKKTIKLYTDAKSYILDSIKNKKEIKESIVINFFQSELHDILYSYINGGFSKKGFIFYPFLKDLSKANIQKIHDLRIVAEFLGRIGHNFGNSLDLYKKERLNSKNAQLFISNLYRDFSNIKKQKTETKKIRCKKFDFEEYDKGDSGYLEPVLGLNKFAENKLKEYLVDLHVHGSIATRDYVKGWSDLDTLIVIKKEVLNNPKLLIELRDLLYRSKKYFYKIDPLQHHGHMAITEYDLDHYCQTFFPLVLFKYSKSVFSNKILNFKIRLCDVENICRFYSFVSYFKNLYLNKKFNMSSYELKFFLHAITLFPTLYLQAKGIHVYKKFSFDLARKDFEKKLCGPVDAVSNIRQKWKTLIKMPLINIISNVNPLLAYQINSKYWDLFNKITKLNDVDIKKLVIQMNLLSEKSWEKIRLINHF